MDGATYMGRVAGLRCRICARLGLQLGASEVHHQRSGTGGGRRAGDLRTIPLCAEHHRGASGIHGLGTKAFAREYGVSEPELVAEVWALLGVDEGFVTALEGAARARRKARVGKVTAADRVTEKVKRQYNWPKRKLESRNTLQARPFPAQLKRS